jgi:O-antigen/teichoic acid export membrane protein
LNSRPFRFSRLVTNFALLSGGELVSKLFALAAFAYLARILGPMEYGNLELAVAIIFFFTFFVDCGLSQYGGREVAKDVNAVTYLTPHIIFIRFLWAVFAFGFLVLLVVIIDKPWPLKRLILLYGLTLFVLPGYLPWVFQGRDLMHYVAFASVIRWSIFAGGVFLFIRGTAQTWVVPIVETIGMACVVFFYTLIFRSFFGPFRPRIDKKLVLSIFRQALPIGASEWVWSLKLYFATVFLGLWVGGPQVGWFSAVHRIIISSHAFVSLYFFNLLPSIARCSQGSAETLEHLTYTSMKWTAWSAIFVALLGGVLAEPVLTLIYGSQYREGVMVFRILIWFIPLTLMSGHFRFALIGYNQQRLEFAIAACGAGLNIVLNLLLIPMFGMVGGAWSLVATEGFIWGLAYYVVRRKVAPIRVWGPISRPLIGALMVTTGLFLLPPVNVWMAGGSVVLLYGLFLSIMQPKILSHFSSFFVHRR